MFNVKELFDQLNWKMASPNVRNSINVLLIGISCSVHTFYSILLEYFHIKMSV